MASLKCFKYDIKAHHDDSSNQTTSKTNQAVHEEMKIQNTHPSTLPTYRTIT